VIGVNDRPNLEWINFQILESVSYIGVYYNIDT
jgi:hypothetical protein